MRLLNQYKIKICAVNIRNKKFLNWIRKKISPQAIPNKDSVAVDDFNKEGTKEWSYPKEFKIGKDSYSWRVDKHIGSGIWFEGKAFEKLSKKQGTYSVKISPWPLTKAKLFKGFAIIYDYYN